ncbi:MAG: tetratricopeptide repeat protein [Clostridia bacterium]|nr:tetratricopeptide repeat protein [Clostridia bacterium]
MPTDKNKDKRGKVLSFERDNSFFVQRGDARRAQNDPVSAMAMYNEALERDPDDLDTRLAAAQLLTDMSRFNDSNRLLIPYMHKDEDYRREAYCIVGFNLIGLNESDGARLCFERFFESTDEVSPRTDAMLDALDYLDSAEPEEEYLKDASDAYLLARLGAAATAFENGNFPFATKLFGALFEKYPSNLDVNYRYALSLLCEKRYEESRAAAGNVLEKDAAHIGALSVAMLASNATGNELDCAQLAKRLENADTNDIDELFRINGALIECGRFEQAESSGRKLVKLLPYSPQANHRLAISLMKQGKYQKAAELYDKLLKIDRSDLVAKYFMTGCLDALNKGGTAFPEGHVMVHYQVPFGEIIETVRSIIDNKDAPPEQIAADWKTDRGLRDRIRWSFSLGEFNIICAMTALLRVIGDENAELLLREVISDIDVSDAVINEVLGALKAINAPEPYFAMAGGRLLEGRVNVVDLDKAHIPANYRSIFPRIMKVSDGLYSTEVFKTAGTITERFLVGSSGEYRHISKKQSVALSAAVEFLACEKCGAMVADDLCERYGITERRLENAVNRLIGILMQAGDKAADIEAGHDGEYGDE